MLVVVCTFPSSSTRQSCPVSVTLTSAPIATPPLESNHTKSPWIEAPLSHNVPQSEPVSFRILWVYGRDVSSYLTQMQHGRLRLWRWEKVITFLLVSYNYTNSINTVSKIFVGSSHEEKKTQITASFSTNSSLCIYETKWLWRHMMSSLPPALTSDPLFLCWTVQKFALNVSEAGSREFRRNTPLWPFDFAPVKVTPTSVHLCHHSVSWFSCLVVYLEIKTSLKTHDLLYNHWQHRLQSTGKYRGSTETDCAFTTWKTSLNRKSEEEQPSPNSNTMLNSSRTKDLFMMWICSWLMVSNDGQNIMMSQQHSIFTFGI